MSTARKLGLLLLGLPKTLLFNFRYLPFRQAIRLPVVVSHRVWLMKLGGRVTVNATAPASVKIGFGEVGVFDRARSRTIWEVRGHVVFEGRANIGHGSKVSARGTLTLGDNFVVTAESTVICYDRITFGRDALLSWDVLVMDTDFHVIRDATGGPRLNPDAPVTIGDGVWIGCRAMILKGVSIADGSVVGAGSTVHRSTETPGAIVAGSPARVVREGIAWEL